MLSTLLVFALLQSQHAAGHCWTPSPTANARRVRESDTNQVVPSACLSTAFGVARGGSPLPLDAKNSHFNFRLSLFRSLPSAALVPIWKKMKPLPLLKSGHGVRRFSSPVGSIGRSGGCYVFTRFVLSSERLGLGLYPSTVPRSRKQKASTTIEDWFVARRLLCSLARL